MNKTGVLCASVTINYNLATTAKFKLKKKKKTWILAHKSRGGLQDDIRKKIASTITDFATPWYHSNISGGNCRQCYKPMRITFWNGGRHNDAQISTFSYGDIRESFSSHPGRSSAQWVAYSPDWSLHLPPDWSPDPCCSSPDTHTSADLTGVEKERKQYLILNDSRFRMIVFSDRW